MITSIFSKSKPVNFIIVAVAVLLLFIITNLEFKVVTVSTVFDYGLRLGIALFFIVLTDFIIAKNNLTKKNGYGIMVLGLFFFGFPETLKENHVMISGLFVLFALRRLLSLHTNRHIKKKFFDAAFWIALATLSYTWALLFFTVIIIALLYYWQNNLKNIAVSFLGVITVFCLLVVYNILTLNRYFEPSLFSFNISFDFSYFNSPSQVVALTVVISLYIWSLFHYFNKIVNSNKKLKPSFILIALSSLLAFVLVLIVPNKNGSELLFIGVPFSIISASYFEKVPVKWFKETLVSLLLLIPVLRLFL